MRETGFDGKKGAEREALDRRTMAEPCATKYCERALATRCSSSPMVRRHVQQILPRSTVP